jgi:hypothetical protein
VPEGLPSPPQKILAHEIHPDGANAFKGIDKEQLFELIKNPLYIRLK